jgi:ELWxxDGT repeat protein
VGRWLAYFELTSEQQQRELWRTDGTTAGTIRLGDWQYGWAWDGSLAIVDERLYYTFDDGIHGEEIWTSDGSPGGTRLLADVVPGATGSQPSSFTAANHALYFLADDGIHGREIWTIPAGHAPPRRR